MLKPHFVNLATINLIFTKNRSLLKSDNFSALIFVISKNLKYFFTQFLQFQLKIL